MIIAVIFFLYALYAVAGRDLSEPEMQALSSIWGVRKKQALLDLEANPKQFLLNRKKELLSTGPNKIFTPREFCELYIADAKTYIAQQPQERASTLWFKDPEAIDDVIKDYLDEASPLFLDVRFKCYATACDYIGDLCGRSPGDLNLFTREEQKQRAVFGLEADFRAFLFAEKERNWQGFPECMHEKLCWKILPGGKSCLIDHIILRWGGRYLCSAPSKFNERTNYFEHEGKFEGWWGVYTHNVLSRTMCSCKLAHNFGQCGLSYNAYFNDCCNPEDLVSGNLMIMSRQVLAWFYQFYELPDLSATYKDSVSMIFPSTPSLTDIRFMDIVPYFMAMPPEYDWRETPLSRQICTPSLVNKYLLAWRSQYCYKGVHFLDKGEISRYLDELENEFLCLRQCDIALAPHFVQGVLERLYLLELISGVIQPPAQEFASFEKDLNLFVSYVLIELQRLAPAHRSLQANVPHSVRFILLTCYADALRDINSVTNVSFAQGGGASPISIVDENGGCLVTFRGCVTRY